MKKKNRSFIDCSQSERLLFTFSLLLIGLACLMTMFYLYTSYVGIHEVANGETNGSLDILVKLSHIHLFGIGLVLFILGYIFKHTVLPGWVKYPLLIIPFLAAIVYILLWFLAKWDYVYAYSIVIASIFLGMSLSAQILISLYQIWFLRSDIAKFNSSVKSRNDNNSIIKIYQVVLGVCLVSSFLVSMAVVKLNPRQKENQRLEKIKNILQVADLYDENNKIDVIYQKKIVKQWIELNTGETLDESTTTFKKLSINALAKDSVFGESIPPSLDIANIKRRPKYMPVYFVKNINTMQKIILPIYGKGLWSTLYGFLALEGDVKTISGITFYQQGETPGLGGEISKPRWQKLWRGKQAFDVNGKVVISIIKGEVNPNSPKALHHVDGISGATLTSRGVNNLVQYWLSNQGYGHFLNSLRNKQDE